MSGLRPLALVHDYLTQQGGAERVVLALAAAFPDAPLFTSLYDPERTFPEFAHHDVHTLPLDRIAVLRDHHRLALPLLAPAFSRLRVDAEVVLCSSSGWAHGARVGGRKVVYCHTPARWLYQADRYLDGSSLFSAAGLAALSPTLRRWDRRAAASADRYLVNSSAVKARVADLYGIEADVVPPPVDHRGRRTARGAGRARAGVPPVCVEAACLQERRRDHRGLLAPPRPATRGRWHRPRGIADRRQRTAKRHPARQGG